MKKIGIFTALLCILNSIILVNQDLGINVILFTIPLLVFIVWVLKSNDLIKNKTGLLFLIPIIILSSTYFIFDNSMKYLNIIVIPFLYLLMYIFTIKPVSTITDTIIEILNLIIKPLNNIGLFTKDGMKELPKKEKKKGKHNERNIEILKSLLIVVPVVIVVLMLLSSADQIFGQLFDKLFSFKFSWDFMDELVTRLILFVMLFFYLGSTLHFLKNEYLKEKRVKKESKEHKPLTMNMLLTALNIIYLVFDIIQINSLLLHRVSTGFNYAEYARSGFFQLMIISIINISIILLSKKSKETNFVKIMSIVLVLLTYVIIVSSYFRMSLYEQAYGYTVLRLWVYIILITEGILLLPTIVYILNKNINILGLYLVIGISAYTLNNCVSLDRIIAENNIERYERTGKIDLYYLQNNNYDNLNQLRELYKKVEQDKEIGEIDKNNFRFYIGRMDKKNKTNLFEYNISKEQAKEKRD